MDDLDKVDVASIRSQAVTITCGSEKDDADINDDREYISHHFSIKIKRFLSVMKEFREILSKQATIEAFTEWLDNVVDAKMILVNICDADKYFDAYNIAAQ